MKQGLFSSSKPGTKLLLFIFLILCCFILTNVVGLLAAPLIFKTDYYSLINLLSSLDYNNHFHINILKYFQILQALGFFVLPSILAAYLFSSSKLSFLMVEHKTKKSTLLLSCIIVIIAMPAIDLMVKINEAMHLPAFLKGLEEWMLNSEKNAKIITEAFLNVTTLKGLFLNIIMIGVLPAIGEEFVFRGVLQRIFKNWTKNSHIAIIISAILFSGIHLQFYGFIPRMLLGVMFGYLLLWTNSIWVPVIAHFINNTTAIIVNYMMINKIHIFNYNISDFENMIDDSSRYLLIFSSFIITGLIMFIFYKSKVVNTEN
ncbi:MAG: CPBP family intramembrane metalloprotease [Bacteroidales bacterium]|nr:CPBP family intramembrane metalloprotease [Bacteroidales bacterium]